VLVASYLVGRTARGGRCRLVPCRAVARRGAHREGRGGRRAVGVVAAILILGAVGAGAWFLFLREGAPIPLTESAEVADFSFDLIRVKGDSPAGNLDPDDLQDQAESVKETIDALYVAGYVDPSKWEGGTFPEVLDQFAEQARRQAKRDLDQLTLGDDSANVTDVRPVNGRLEVKFLADGEGTPVGAVAEALFAANATAKSGGPVSMQHDGTYYLRPDGDRWLIIGYDVRGIVTPVERPLPSPGGDASP
jgi:hypothetical protein